MGTERELKNCRVVATRKQHHVRVVAIILKMQAIDNHI